MEMSVSAMKNLESHPPRGGWIEIERRVGYQALEKSHPPRGGWIEILIPR